MGIFKIEKIDYVITNLYEYAHIWRTEIGTLCFITYRFFEFMALKSSIDMSALQIYEYVDWAQGKKTVAYR